MEKVVRRKPFFYTVPMLFTATETFNVGKDLLPVALDYFDRAPFPSTA